MAAAVAVLVDRVGDEEIDRDEHDAADPHRDQQGVVGQLPVRRQRRQPPRAPELEGHGSHGNQHEHYCQHHAGLLVGISGGPC